jgi:excisionase family DNA binding protein
MSQLTEEKLLSVGDVCTLTGCCPLTVYRAVRKEKLPALRMGRHIKILASDLENYLKRG